MLARAEPKDHFSGGQLENQGPARLSMLPQAQVLLNWCPRIVDPGRWDVPTLTLRSGSTNARSPIQVRACLRKREAGPDFLKKIRHARHLPVSKILCFLLTGRGVPRAP